MVFLSNSLLPLLCSKQLNSVLLLYYREAIPLSFLNQFAKMRIRSGVYQYGRIVSPRSLTSMVDASQQTDNDIITWQSIRQYLDGDGYGTSVPLDENCSSGATANATEATNEDAGDISMKSRVTDALKSIPFTPFSKGLVLAAAFSLVTRK